MNDDTARGATLTETPSGIRFGLTCILEVNLEARANIRSMLRLLFRSHHTDRGNWGHPSYL
jgi:hypothetical protein